MLDLRLCSHLNKLRAGVVFPPVGVGGIGIDTVVVAGRFAVSQDDAAIHWLLAFELLG